MLFAGEDDSVLISGSDDRTVKVWDVKSRDTRPIMSWDEAKDGITCLTLGTCDRGSGTGMPWEVISGSVDGRVRSYDIRTGRCTTDVMPAPVVSLDITKDGGGLLIGCMDSRLRLIDKREGTLLQSFGGSNNASAESTGDPSGFVNTTVRLRSAFNTDESLVAVGSEKDGKVRAWDVLTGEEVHGIDTAATPAAAIASSGRSSQGKCVSVVTFRRGTSSQTGSIWACGGLDGIVWVYGR